MASVKRDFSGFILICLFILLSQLFLSEFFLPLIKLPISFRSHNKARPLRVSDVAHALFVLFLLRSPSWRIK